MCTGQTEMEDTGRGFHRAEEETPFRYKVKGILQTCKSCNLNFFVIGFCDRILTIILLDFNRFDIGQCSHQCLKNDSFTLAQHRTHQNSSQFLNTYFVHLDMLLLMMFLLSQMQYRYKYQHDGSLHQIQSMYHQMRQQHWKMVHLGHQWNLSKQMKNTIIV